MCKECSVESVLSVAEGGEERVPARLADDQVRPLHHHQRDQERRVHRVLELLLLAERLAQTRGYVRRKEQLD